jgi:hypothetical protein
LYLQWDEAPLEYILLCIQVKAEVISLWSVDNAIAGNSTTLWARIKNVGSSNFSNDVEAWFWIDGPCWEGNHWVGSESLEGLVPNQTAWYTYRWDIPGDFIAGTYTYWVRVFENNNVAVSEWSQKQSFHISASLGVEVLSLFEVEEAVSGQTASLWSEIKNVGFDSLPSNTLLWFWVTGPNWSGAHFVGNVLITGLKTNEVKWYKYDWFIPIEKMGGDYTYWTRVFYY